MRAPATFLFVATVSCGGAVIDTTIEDDGEINPTCPAACTSDNTCCPGYACEAGSCTPSLTDGRCWSADFTVACDPRLDGQCGAGQSCTSQDVVNVDCFSYQHIGRLGDSCSEADEGCGAGLWCMLDFCREACCSDGDCPNDSHCVINYGQIGSFGVCYASP